LGHAAKEWQHRVREAAQDRDHEGTSWIRLDPRADILDEREVEDLVSGFDTSVPTDDEHFTLFATGPGG